MDAAEMAEECARLRQANSQLSAHLNKAASMGKALLDEKERIARELDGLRADLRTAQEHAVREAERADDAAQQAERTCSDEVERARQLEGENAELWNRNESLASALAELRAAALESEMVRSDEAAKARANAAPAQRRSKSRPPRALPAEGADADGVAIVGGADADGGAGDTCALAEGRADAPLSAAERMEFAAWREEREERARESAARRRLEAARHNQRGASLRLNTADPDAAAGGSSEDATLHDETPTEAVAVASAPDANAAVAATAAVARLEAAVAAAAAMARLEASRAVCAQRTRLAAAEARLADHATVEAAASATIERLENEVANLRSALNAAEAGRAVRPLADELASLADAASTREPSPPAPPPGCGSGGGARFGCVSRAQRAPVPPPIDATPRCGWWLGKRDEPIKARSGAKGTGTTRAAPVVVVEPAAARGPSAKV